ncbi:MAG: outer membrane beta-barrel protein [Massilia sp.]
MKKITLALTLAIAAMGAAHAQDNTAAPAAKQTRFFLHMGLTGGGDKIANIQYTDGTDGNVTFGSLVQLGAGVDYRVNESFSLQASINDHVSSQGGDNGSVRFTRFPMELIAYYNVSPQWRIGAGARYVSGAKIKSRGVASDIGNGDFDNAVGALVEAEYAIGEHVGIKLRYVSEKYQLSGTNYKAKGNHAGVFGAYYF